MIHEERRLLLDRKKKKIAYVESRVLVLVCVCARANEYSKYAFCTQYTLLIHPF